MLALSHAKIGQLTWVAEWHPGQANVEHAAQMAKDYEAHAGKLLFSPRMLLTRHMPAAVIDKAAYADAFKIARAMEDLTMPSEVGPSSMRGKNHQILLQQIVNAIAPVDGQKVTLGWEGSKYGFRTDAVVSGQGWHWIPSVR